MIVVLVLLFAVAAKGAYEGDSCSKDGVAGVCRNLKECSSALEGIKNKQQPQHCGFSGQDIIVCCLPSVSKPAKPATTTTTKRSPVSYTDNDDDYIDVDDKASVNAGAACPPIDPSLTSRPTGQKAWDKCLEYQERLVFPCLKSTALGGKFDRFNRCYHNADELIIGGVAAAENEFPHMVLLGYEDEAGVLHWQCGGSLISENFVLTAGHCIASKERWNVSHVQVRTQRRSRMSPQNRFRVRSIVPHPRYASPNKYHDIALLQLDRPVPLDEYAVPACLHTGAPVNDTLASVSGWGLTSKDGQVSDTLQKVILTKFDVLECAVQYRPGSRHMMEGYDDNTQVCFGDRTKSRDTCQGDSGGPLQIKSKQIVCMYTLMGVTSFGDKCGFIGVPGIYTRVAHYLDWIERIVWP